MDIPPSLPYLGVNWTYLPSNFQRMWEITYSSKHVHLTVLPIGASGSPKTEINVVMENGHFKDILPPLDWSHDTWPAPGYNIHFAQLSMFDKWDHQIRYKLIIKNIIISAHDDGGPRSRVCACKTIRSAPQQCERKFSGAHVCRVTFKHLSQFLRSHIWSFGTLVQLLQFTPKKL